jgi:hypothetical protein
MFEKRAALNESADIIVSQILSARGEASPAQLKIIESGNKFRSTFVLGYFAGIISVEFQKRGVNGYVPGTAIQKVARKVQGSQLETVLAGLIVRMDSDKAKMMYEYGQNAAAVDDHNSSRVMFKNYLLNQFDFDEDGKMVKITPATR